MSLGWVWSGLVRVKDVIVEFHRNCYSGNWIPRTVHNWPIKGVLFQTVSVAVKFNGFHFCSKGMTLALIQHHQDDEINYPHLLASPSTVPTLVGSLRWRRGAPWNCNPHQLIFMFLPISSAFDVSTNCNKFCFVIYSVINLEERKRISLRQCQRRVIVVFYCYFELSSFNFYAPKK